ncbi:CPBP family intramembrane glutamic endopeptidase [Nocardia sp. NPDC057663]|uniref:CPBP family intramembrane glutamic endopeptidase n=1 Tax=Nocardia sp. NPDC057663 TaxID=3346201 RepID=UPI003670D267
MRPIDRAGSALSHAELSTGRRRLRRFRFPVLVLVLLSVIAAFAGIDRLVAPVPALALPVGIGLAGAGVVGYRWLSRTVESRPSVPELATAGTWSWLWRGMLLGSGLFTAVMLLIAAFGGWQGLSWGSVGGFLATAGAMAAVAVAEETLFRGIVFRIVEERTGTVVALVVSALLFGAAHLVNVDATLLGTLSIAVTGGTLTAAAYVATRSLWLPIGLHFGWNFIQAGVFGVTVSGSGTASHGLLHTTLSGSSLLTGGAFGPEASLFALLVCLVPTAVLLRRAARTGQIRHRPRGTSARGSSSRPSSRVMLNPISD